LALRASQCAPGARRIDHNVRGLRHRDPVKRQAEDAPDVAIEIISDEPGRGAGCGERNGLVKGGPGVHDLTLCCIAGRGAIRQANQQGSGQIGAGRRLSKSLYEFARLPTVAMPVWSPDKPRNSI
jgi:hypothetical protein